jgi:hypothetical protein
MASTFSVPQWALSVMAGGAGLAVGSFLNVVVYRVPRGLSVVRPASACPSCRTPISSLDNIPVVSWLVLGGHCRSCGAPISARYPLVEAGTGVLFASVTLAVGPHWAVVGLCALSATLAACLASELDGESLGWRTPALGTVLGVAGLVGAGIAERHWAHLGGAAAGTALAAGAAPALDHWMAALGASGARRTPEALLSVTDRRRSWALLPAGAVLGWAGPAGAAAGTGVLCLLLLGLPGTGATRAVGGRAVRDDGAVRNNGGRAARRRQRAPRGPLANAGPAVAASTAAVVAVAVALAVGAALS